MEICKLDDRHNQIAFDGVPSRILEVDNETKPNYKYQEILQWDANKNNEIVCIGFNPADASKEIDTTNSRIIKLLKEKGYGGYTLLNLYPQITDNKTQVDLEGTENTDFFDKIKEYFERDESKNKEVLIFWGRSHVISEDIKKWLVSKINEKKLCMTVHTYKKDGSTLFTHPGSNTDIQMVDVKETNIKSSFCIK